MNQQQKLVQKLKRRIQKAEVAGRTGAEQTVSSGCAMIDGVLPAGGYVRGSLVQWVTAGGQAADYFSLLTAREACRDGGSLVIIDPQNEFYPPAAATMGLPLDRTIILRDQAELGSRAKFDAKFGDQESKSLEDNDFLWSIDQALRCVAVAAVWGPLAAIDARWFRRFKLSAETSGCLGLFVQPPDVLGQPSWADVQWQTDNVNVRAAGTTTRRNHQPVRMRLSRCRGTFAGQTLCLNINIVTGDVQPA